MANEIKQCSCPGGICPIDSTTFIPDGKNLWRTQCATCVSSAQRGLIPPGAIKLFDTQNSGGAPHRDPNKYGTPFLADLNRKRAEGLYGS